MDFKFPKIVREIDLSEYAPEYQVKIQVWVNPTRDVVLSFRDAVANIETSKDKLRELLVLLWSQGSDVWSIDDVENFINGCDNTDPALFGWCVFSTIGLIAEHRRGVKKKQNEPPS